MSPETKQCLDFGDFRLDRAEKVLSCEGNAIALTPKVFDTLEVLLANPGHLLSKDELISKIWPDHFVEESNLTFNIKMLRRALGDDAANPRFIETIPRRGYRFIAEVHEILEKVRNVQATIGTIQPPRRSYLPIAAIIVLLLGSIALASWLVRKEFGGEPTAPILSSPFHSQTFSSSGKVSIATISPDGKLVVFADEADGKYGVWLRHLETSENIQIIPPSDDFYFGFAFAHDGRTLYFVRCKQTGPTSTSADIYRVSISGGVPEKILEHAEGWISLSPDDKQISFVRCKYQREDFCSLLIADSSGQNEQKLLTRAAPIRITDNQFSPDGRELAFASGESFNGASDFTLSKIDIASRAETEVSTRRFFEITSLKWLPDGSDLLAAARETLDGKANIWQVSARTGEARVVTRDAANYVRISLDKDASAMMATLLSNNFQLYLSSNGVTRSLTAAREPAFAPDGRIIYSAEDGHIWTINREGGEQRQLTKSAFKDFRPYVSPDGRYIYFTSNRTGTNQIWRMDRDGSNQIEITKNEGGYPVFVSPDTKWVYYESGLHATLWKVSTDGDDESPVLETRVYRPAFSPDGAFVAFFFHGQEIGDRTRIAVMATASNEIVKVLDFVEPESTPIQIAWSGDGRNIDYVTGNAMKNTLWRQSVDESTPRLIADLGDKEVAHFALAADGDDYIYTRGEWLHDAVLLDGLR